MRKQVGYKLSALSFCIATSSCYVTTQAYWQNNLINSRKPLAQVLKDPNVTKTEKDKLNYLQSSLQYAKNQGLETEDSYDYYIQNKEPYVSYTLQAAYKDRLENFTWWFPFVGRVPYIGYFAKKDRDEYAKVLEAQDFDIDLGNVSAFSSLGWFSDPIYKSMLNRPFEDLCATLFHELTHKNLWLSGQSLFNEQLASFVEDMVTTQFLKEKNLESELKRYELKQKDRLLFTQWLEELRRELETLYAKALPTVLTEREKLFTKYLLEKKPRFLHADYVGDTIWNNANVLSASMYHPDHPRFQKAYTCSKATSAGDFLKVLKKQCESANDGFSCLDSLCRI